MVDWVQEAVYAYLHDFSRASLYSGRLAANFHREVASPISNIHSGTAVLSASAAHDALVAQLLVEAAED